MRSTILRTVFPILKPSAFHTRSINSGFKARYQLPVLRMQSTMSTGTSGILSAGELGIENTNIETAPGVQLNETQKTVVGSVLDLFQGKPSLKKLSIWTENASFQDPITNSHGRKQYSAQWYGLPAAFSQITRLGYSVTSSNNPITMNLKTNYKLKGVGKETVIDSLVEIWTVQEGEERGRIEKVVDKWNGELPEGMFVKAFRNLNAVTVPYMISVPKNEEEDAKKGL